MPIDGDAIRYRPGRGSTSGIEFVWCFRVFIRVSRACFVPARLSSTVWHAADTHVYAVLRSIVGGRR